jgi:hypothetical protein
MKKQAHKNAPYWLFHLFRRREQYNHRNFVLLPVFKALYRILLFLLNVSTRQTRRKLERD